MWNTILIYISNALFPPQCIPCGKLLAGNAAHETICKDCFEKIPRRSGFICGTCGARQPSLYNECHKGSPVVLAATDYSNNEARALIRAIKYEHRSITRVALADLVARAIDSRPEFIQRGTFVLLPIPLHPRKERRRGYNQSLHIANVIAGHYSEIFELHDTVLKRVIDNPSQTSCLTHTERTHNIAGAFTVINADIIRGRIVVVFDDVFTSGATLREAAWVLKRAGARGVIGLVIAKA